MHISSKQVSLIHASMLDRLGGLFGYRSKKWAKPTPGNQISPRSFSSSPRAVAWTVGRAEPGGLTFLVGQGRPLRHHRGGGEPIGRAAQQTAGGARGGGGGGSSSLQRGLVWLKLLFFLAKAKAFVGPSHFGPSKTKPSPHAYSLVRFCWAHIGLIITAKHPLEVQK